METNKIYDLNPSEWKKLGTLLTEHWRHLAIPQGEEHGGCVHIQCVGEDIFVEFNDGNVSTYINDERARILGIYIQNHIKYVR